MNLRTFLNHARTETTAGALGWVGGWPGLWLSGGGGIFGTWIGGMLAPESGAAIGGVVGFVLALGALFGFNLLRAETRIWRQRAETAEADLAALRTASMTSTSAAPDTPTPERDWSIRDLFFYIRPDVLGRENGREVWLIVGEQVRQAIEDNKLHVWGRACGEDGRDVDESEKPPLMLLPRHTWHRATFSYQFFAENSEDNVHLFVQEAIGRSHFCDMRVNSAEARSAFRTNNPDPKSGDWQNDWFVYHEPRPLISGQYSHGESPMGHRFHIADIPPRARVRYLVETNPAVSSWKLGLSESRNAFDRVMNPDHEREVRLDEDGYTWFCANGTTMPEMINVRVKALSWCRNDAR